MTKTKFLLPFFFSTLSLLAVAQEEHTAYFTFFEATGNQLILHVKANKNDLEKTLKNSDQCNETTDFSRCAAAYIKQRFHCKINGAMLSLEKLGSTDRNNFLITSFSVVGAPQDIETIHIKNTCFAELGHEYKNMVQFKIRGEDVLYEMNKSQTTIFHDFKESQP